MRNSSSASWLRSSGSAALTAVMARFSPYGTKADALASRNGVLVSASCAQQARRRPALAVLLMPAGDLVVDLAHADAVGPEHQPAAIAREAEAVQPHHVDVAGAIRLALLEDPAGLVDRGEQQAAQDFLVGERALRHAHLGGDLPDDGGHLRIGMRRAVAFLVAIPAGAGLLAIAAHLHQSIGDRQLAVVRIRRGAPTCGPRHRYRARPDRPPRTGPSDSRNRPSPCPPARAGSLPRAG